MLQVQTAKSPPPFNPPTNIRTQASAPNPIETAIVSVLWQTLIMQRLSWLMASQSFLFTAYAIVTNGMTTSPASGGNVFVNHLLTLVRIIPVVALLNSLLIAISILAALKAIRELRDGYRKEPEPLEMIPLQTSKSARVLGLSAPVLLPPLFLAVWLYLLVQ